MSWGFRDGWGAFWGHDDDGVNIVIIMIMIMVATDKQWSSAGLHTVSVSLWVPCNDTSGCPVRDIVKHHGCKVVYLKQWDIRQFISNNGIYDNLSQTMVYMTIYLVKEASRHGLPFLLGENGVHSNLLHLIAIEVDSSKVLVVLTITMTSRWCWDI